MSIAHRCVILHNVIVRMQQTGDFRDEAGGEDLITEFLNDNGQEKNDAAMEYEENRRRRQSKITMDSEEKVVRWILNDIHYTYLESFVELQAEFIRHHDEIGHDAGLPVA